MASPPASILLPGGGRPPKLPLDIFTSEGLARIHEWTNVKADARQKKHLSRVLDIAGDRADSTLAGATAADSSKKALRIAKHEEKLEKIHLFDKNLIRSTYQTEYPEGGAGAQGEALGAKVDHFRLIKPYMKGIVRPERMAEVEEWVRAAGGETNALIDRRKLLFEALVSLSAMDSKTETEFTAEYRPKPIPAREPAGPPAHQASGAAASPSRRPKKGTGELPPLARSAPEVLIRQATGPPGPPAHSPAKRDAGPFAGVVPGGGTETTYKSFYVPRMHRAEAADVTNWHRLPSDGCGMLVPQLAPGGVPAKPIYDARRYRPLLPADRTAIYRAEASFQYPWPLSTAHGSFQPADPDDPIMKSVKRGSERSEALKLRARASEVPLSIGIAFKKDTTYTESYDGRRLHPAPRVAPF